MKKPFFCFLLIYSLFLRPLSTQVCAQKESFDFSKEDRVLILAPHPDDEAIGAAGVIQKALLAGARVKVVCYTNGENNEVSFIVYEKRIPFKQKEFLQLGEIRRQESVAAMESLGISRNDLVFLGYPDFGTMEILTKYWGEGKPFRSMFARVSEVSYPEAKSFGAPYKGESILFDLKSIILGFQPTKIFVSHPADTNRDHQSLYLFLKVVLLELEDKIAPPQVFPYLIHVFNWPKPRGFHPEKILIPPKHLTQVLWEELPLKEDEIEKKHRAIAFYKSQIECDPPYLFTFARKNELYGDFPTILLSENKNQTEQWNYLETLQLKQARKHLTQHISSVAYMLKDKELLIKLQLRRRIDKLFGISVFLLGYKRGVEFSQMPKINISIGLEGLRIKDKRAVIFVKGAKWRYEDNTIVITLPLSALGDPQYILSRLRSHVGIMITDDNAWRVIELVS